jgi:hypothetical protein
MSLRLCPNLMSSFRRRRGVRGVSFRLCPNLMSSFRRRRGVRRVSLRFCPNLMSSFRRRRGARGVSLRLCPNLMSSFRRRRGVRRVSFGLCPVCAVPQLQPAVWLASCHRLQDSPRYSFKASGQVCGKDPGSHKKLSVMFVIRGGSSLLSYFPSPCNIMYGWHPVKVGKVHFNLRSCGKRQFSAMSTCSPQIKPVVMATDSDPIRVGSALFCRIRIGISSYSKQMKKLTNLTFFLENFTMVSKILKNKNQEIFDTDDKIKYC